ncbi:MAG: hypothetical protein E6R03_05970 [Hyphomicrobiaceae bacterium]|nr:MAG: hypothetical protein E6R03_05970 [Hyphomicrobiaceae bacterium]
MSKVANLVRSAYIGVNGSLTKNSPHILFGAGIVGMAASTALACKATLEAKDIVDEIRAEIKEITEDKDEIVRRTDNNGTYEKALAFKYAESGAKVLRVYSPAILVGGLSLTALIGSHIQLTRRNAALTATVATLAKAYDSYRARVREVLGEEEERDIYMGVERDKKTKATTRVSPTPFSPYARLFEESNLNWRNNAEYNLMFIKAQLNAFNYKLQSRGHVFLNEVYDGLGMPRTVEGQVVGWVLDGEGDNYIDFGLREAFSSAQLEKNFWLDFNVDGVVYDKI